MRRPRRRPEPPAWEKNWRNPDMLAQRSYLQLGTLGAVEKVVKEMTPEESSDLSLEEITLGSAPEWHQDPSYHWAREVRRARKRRRK